MSIHKNQLDTKKTHLRGVSQHRIENKWLDFICICRAKHHLACFRDRLGTNQRQDMDYRMLIQYKILVFVQFPVVLHLQALLRADAEKLTNR
jgi:hypothetical protein